MLKSKLVLVSCVAIVAGLLAARAASGSIPHTNYLTFSAPFALPGVTLPAGTYTFDVLYRGSEDVIRVSSRNGAHVYLTAFTVRVQRPKGLPVTRQIVFNEVATGMTPPVKAWFPIGQAIGHEFRYATGNRQGADATK
jgi:hypothetical protein